MHQIIIESPRFKSLLGYLEAEIRDLTISDINLEEANDLDTLFRATRVAVIENIRSYVENSGLARVPTRTEATSTLDLIGRGLGTSKATAGLIQLFLDQTARSDTNNLEEFVKRFVRDLLSFNLNCLGPINQNYEMGRIDGIGISEQGKLAIVGPSHLYTAKQLSELFASEEAIVQFKRIGQAMLGDTSTMEPNVRIIATFLIRLLMCNPSDIRNRIIVDFERSIKYSGQSISTLFNQDRQKLNTLGQRLGDGATFGFYTNSASSLYSNMTKILINELDELLIDCPLRTTIQTLIEQDRFYPTIINTDDIQATEGCPAYFHNIALVYVVKGLEFMRELNLPTKQVEEG